MSEAGVFLGAALTTLLLGKPVIGWLAGIKARQTIYAYAPETHRAKEGTPTMGGLLLILGVAVGLALGGWQARDALVPMLVIFSGAAWFALIGLVDDYWIRRWTRAAWAGVETEARAAAGGGGRECVCAVACGVGDAEYRLPVRDCQWWGRGAAAALRAESGGGGVVGGRLGECVQPDGWAGWAGGGTDRAGDGRSLCD